MQQEADLAHQESIGDIQSQSADTEALTNPLQEKNTFTSLGALVQPTLFQQYQHKIFTEYMNIKTRAYEFISPATAFMQMEKKYLGWMSELELLAREKKTEAAMVDKCTALLWWHLVLP